MHKKCHKLIQLFLVCTFSVNTAFSLQLGGLLTKLRTHHSTAITQGCEPEFELLCVLIST